MPDTEMLQETPPETPRERLQRKWSDFFRRRDVRIAAGVLAGIAGIAFGAFMFYYVKFARLIDQKLDAGPFAGTMSIYAAPRTVGVGDGYTIEEIVAQLRDAGYSPARGSAKGRYNRKPGAVEIFPGKQSFVHESAMIEFAGRKISRIVCLDDNTERQQYLLEPPLITNVSDKNRVKRRLVKFTEIPKVLVEAVTSVEDKHFFQHGGFDMFRIAKAAYVDLKEGRKEQGASTLSMQLARGLWLDADKSWRRKAAELLITMHLEEKLTKDQIFEYYCNQVYLGRRGTFNINGFGEGAQIFFGKDIGQLTLPEAAVLAGIVQRPSYFNPFRYPDRVTERRNIVLRLMRQNGYITDAEYATAANAPIRLTPSEPDSVEAQYFVDLVNDELQNTIRDENRGMDYVFTTLDVNLQRAAEEAIEIGMKQVDKLLRRTEAKTGAVPQVALIALDPHTGEIKALSGGRNYAASQLNHVLAMRQPGSIFKPFVYAAALDTALTGGQKILTAASTIVDEPTTFTYGRKTYEPANFHDAWYGRITLRTALAKSVNVATVKVAEMTGYDSIVAVARRAGLNSGIKATPAVALGAYEATPLEMAGAYTVFANNGTYVKPTLISEVRDPEGTPIYTHQPEKRQALDPRIDYLLVNMMQEVLRSGTGAGVRAHGFTVPAAGKTGTSRDGWFAGFTSELLCVVWVGWDDNRDLNLEGAKSALPIWTEFMKRALKYREFRDVKPFKAPEGIVSASICPESGQLATPYCPRGYAEFFVDGTQPAVACPIHGIQLQQAGMEDGFGDINSADRVQLSDRPVAPSSPPHLPPN